MGKCKFKVNDRVIYNGQSGEYTWLIGYTGRIVGFFVNFDQLIAQVEWDERIRVLSHKTYDGHDCAGLCRQGYGWNVHVTGLGLYDEEAENQCGESLTINDRECDLLL